MINKREIPRPTDGELEILKVLWKHGPSTVRVVNDDLSSKKEVVYTTTLKLMQIMSDKGLVTRNTEGRTHIYSAAISEGEIQDKLLNKLLDSAFEGSAGQLVMKLLGNHRSSQAELEEIKQLIEKLEKGE